MPPPPKAKEVHVKVILDPPGNSPPDRPPFHFETTDLPMGPDNFLIFRNCNHPGFLIHYHLVDTDNPGFRFPTAALFPPNPPKQHLSAALYCSVQPPCPTSPSKWGIFDATEVSPDGLTLKVRNLNNGRDDFWYSLRVTKDGGNKYGLLDPGAGNQNGPEQPFTSYWIAPMVTGAIVGLGTFALMDNSLVSPTGLLFGVGGAIVGLIVGLIVGRM